MYYKKLKPLWEKEKTLFAGIFFITYNVFNTLRKHCGKRKNCSLQSISLFPHTVFKRLVLQTCKKPGTVWERVNPFPHNDTFRRPWETSLLKTLWEREKLLVTSNFSFSHNVFYPFGSLAAIFSKFEFVVCKLL